MKTPNWKLALRPAKAAKQHSANSDISHMQGGAYVSIYLHPIEYAEFLIRQEEAAAADSKT